MVVLLVIGAGWYVSRIPWEDTAIIAGLIFWAWRALRGKQLQRDATLRASDVSELSPLAYEDYCALVLRDAGWRAHTTPPQDQGVDVIAVLRGTKVAIQCKMYAHPVGNRAVQEVVAGRLHYGAHMAVVVSPAPYTRSAQALAASTQVLLLHHDQLPMLERLARVR
ncbi:MAG: restriction endonuclease [Burkholderiales bacterium]